MRSLFSNTLYKGNYPQIINTLPPKISRYLEVLWEEMNDCWGNTPNINKWIKKAVIAAEKGNDDAEKLRYLQKYLEDSGYYQRKDKIKSAIEEFGWEPGFIYILTNKYMPNLIKVGRVFGKGKTVSDRIKDKDLNCTGIPCLYDVQFEIYTINTQKSEAQAHARLSRRVGQKEFFHKQKIENAKSTIIEIVKKVDHDAYLQSIGPRQMYIFNPIKITKATSTAAQQPETKQKHARLRLRV